MPPAFPLPKILSDETLRNFPASQRYLIGVSGGRDSVALLHALSASGYRKLIVCHLNHRLRGRDATRDAKFVEKLAASLKLECEMTSLDVAHRARLEKLSLETAARAARYEFFAATARRRRCAKIFLAHHADDLVETFLMNLFRGAGALGLRSIQPISAHGKLTVVRPFLGAWRNEIDAYVAEHRLKFRDDLTNQNLRATRNRMRHRIIPFLEKEFGREIRESIWRAALLAAGENAWMNALLPQIGRELSVAELHHQPVAAQRRMIHRWLGQHEIAGIGFDLVERIRALLDPKTSPAKTNLPRGRFVRRRAQKIFIDD